MGLKHKVEGLFPCFGELFASFDYKSFSKDVSICIAAYFNKLKMIIFLSKFIEALFIL